MDHNQLRATIVEAASLRTSPNLTALAIVYLADTLNRAVDSEISDAIKTVASELGAISMSIGEAS